LKKIVPQKKIFDFDKEKEKKLAEVLNLNKENTELSKKLIDEKN